MFLCHVVFLLILKLLARQKCRVVCQRLYPGPGCRRWLTSGVVRLVSLRRCLTSTVFILVTERGFHELKGTGLVDGEISVMRHPALSLSLLRCPSATGLTDGAGLGFRDQISYHVLFVKGGIVVKVGECWPCHACSCALSVRGQIETDIFSWQSSRGMFGSNPPLRASFCVIGRGVPPCMSWSVHHNV